MSRKIDLKFLDLSNGEKLAYRKTGNGSKVLLFVHGNTNSSKNWDLLMEELPKEEYTIFAVDLRGFGESSYNKKIDSISDFSDDIKLFCDKLGLKDFTIVGWSAGGAVAMRFCIDYQSFVNKLILLEGSSVQGYPIEKDGKYLATREEITKTVKPILWAYNMKGKFILNKIGRWLLKKVCERSMYAENKPEAERYEEYIDEMMKQRNLVDINYALAHFNISSENNGVVKGTGEADQIEVPTLIIQGDRDDVVTMDMAEKNLQEIGNNATMEIIEGAGHSPLVDRLDKLVDIIVDYTA
mgnify:CR=1 FL=1